MFVLNCVVQKISNWQWFNYHVYLCHGHNYNAILAPLRTCMNESKVSYYLHMFCVVSQIGNVFRQQVYLCPGPLRLQLYHLQECSVLALL